MRVDVSLRKRYLAIGSYTGLILALCGMLMLWPLVALLWWPAEAGLARAFVVPGLLLAAGGAALWRYMLPRRGPVFSVQDGGVVVLLSWIVVTFVSSLTLMVIPDTGFTRAFFEAVSAWTTTGLSTLDVEHAPATILLWRSIMQLAGGAGMAIILVTVAGGPLGPGLTAAEGRGDQLVPHVRRSARLVLTIYAGYAVVGTVALRAAGMSWFDAVNHAFPAVSTGGFSTRAASIGYWSSPLVEAVCLPLMVLGGTNFQIAYLLLRGRWRPALRNGEIRTFALLAVLMVVLMLAFVTTSIYPGVGKQLRVALFEVISALTTTGFTTSDGATYRGWPAIGIFLLIPLMLIGGGTGSTAGAMKQYRAHLLFRAVLWELKRLAQPARAVLDTSVWQGADKLAVGDRAVVQVAVFAVAYLCLLVLGTGVLAACGFGLQESLFEFASALGTVGLSVGVTSANAPAPVLWAEILGMFLGRLEIFIVFLALRKLLADGIGMVRIIRR